MKWTVFIIFLCFTVAVSLFVFLFSVCLNDNAEHYYKETEEVALGSDDFNFPYSKQTVLTVPMQNFDDNYIYQINFHPKSELNEEQKEFFADVIKKAASKLKVKKSDFSHGSYQLLKTGIEYNLFFNKNQKRISVFQPLSSTFHMKELSVSSNKKVNIVVPLKGKQQELSTFLDNLVKNVLPVDEYLSLTVVYFNDEFVDDAKALMEEKLLYFPQFEWRFVPANESHFSRGKGIRVGVTSGAKNPSDLLFICDIDVLVLPDFFRRCRANTIYEHQVYFPVLYSLYNPSLVYSLHDKSIPDVIDQLVVNRDNGFWRYFGFGMFCMHRKEFDTVGGIPELSSWGGEDLRFFEQFTKYPFLKVIRSLDSSIFHMFHPKNCSNVGSRMYPSCLQSKANGEGTQVQLGLLLFKLHEGIDVEGILNKRFYYFYWFPLLVFGICVCLTVIMYQRWLLTKLKRSGY